EYEMDGDARRKGATSISMILSMPTGTDSEKLKSAALDFAKEEFANRSWVASLHIDREHPHVHLTIARRDHDGRRFHPNRDDLFRYRQRFAEKLRGRGIEANATPARARGIDPKHEPIAAIKMREKGLVPRIDKSRVQRVERLRKQGVPDPVRAVLIARQATVRATYIRSIHELAASPSAADQMVAQSLQRFVATMPEPEPNSARAVRSARDPAPRIAAVRPTRTAANMAPAVIGGPDTPLECMRKLHDRVMAPDARLSDTPEPKAQPAVSQPDAAARIRAVIEKTRSQSSSTEDPDRTTALSDRLRALTDKISEPSQPLDLTRANEIIRQAEDRDRAQRERDRTPSKDGPSR
ncbi:MAG: hypothetical protein EOO77_17395, partial [Oxalobacteraceae bacterium]